MHGHFKHISAVWCIGYSEDRFMLSINLHEPSLRKLRTFDAAG